MQGRGNGKEEEETKLNEKHGETVRAEKLHLRYSAFGGTVEVSAVCCKMRIKACLFFF